MQPNSLPLVSLVITSYNRASMIPKAIESALAQDYPNLEIIITDNCSTDNTDSIIKKYTSDSRIKYSRNKENIGMLPNFRKAIYELSRGEYIAIVNSDDYLICNTFITDCINLVNKYENVLLVYGRMVFNNTSNGVVWEMPESPYFLKEIWEGKDVFFESMKTVLLSWGACLMKKDAMNAVKSLQPDYYNGDIDSNYKIMLSGKVAFLNKLCYMQMGHEDNHGFPADSAKILHSMDCYKNVASYAIEKLPGDAARFRNWENHFLYHTVKWAFHSLKKKNKTQYKLFRAEIKKNYPVEYKRFVSSSSNLRLMLQPLKKLLPQGTLKVISRARQK